jgi:transcriptional regulator with XRE-family HTH domain
MKNGRERLRDWITRSKVNQTQAAKILGISDVVLSQWLSGGRTPDLKNAVKLEQLTGVSVESWLLTEVPNTAEPVSADGPKS